MCSLLNVSDLWVCFHKNLPMQVRLLGEHTDHEPEEIEKTISRPKYFDPYEAVKYGIIDRVSCFQQDQSDQWHIGVSMWPWCIAMNLPHTLERCSCCHGMTMYCSQEGKPLRLYESAGPRARRGRPQKGHPAVTYLLIWDHNAIVLYWHCRQLVLYGCIHAEICWGPRYGHIVTKSF